MTTNKPGSVNQRPLYGCTSCYEEVTYPASDLRVYDGECWCDYCWDERRWEFPDQSSWNDLEPYTPALQAECEKLRKDAKRYRWLRERFGRFSEHYDGGSDRVSKIVVNPDGWDVDQESLDAAIDAAMEGHQ